MLSNLRELCLENVVLSLPALQPIAARLQTLSITDSRLRGSADGFLSAGWTALKVVCLHGSWVEDDMLTAVNLPALEDLDIISFEHQGGMLQLDQLRCPQLRGLVFLLDSSHARTGEGGRQRCSFSHLARLEDLVVIRTSYQATMDLGLPTSLEHLTVQDSSGDDVVDLKWVLLEAVKGIRGGAHLCSLTCTEASPSSHPEWMPWGACSLAHYSKLGEQLSGLEFLAVCGRGKPLLSAISAVACSAPSLTRLELYIEEELDDLRLPPICSASLESVTLRFRLTGKIAALPPVMLHFLPDCARLRDVHVGFYSKMPKQGT